MATRTRIDRYNAKNARKPPKGRALKKPGRALEYSARHPGQYKAGIAAGVAVGMNTAAGIANIAADKNQRYVFKSAGLFYKSRAKQGYAKTKFRAKATVRNSRTAPSRFAAGYSRGAARARNQRAARSRGRTFVSSTTSGTRRNVRFAGAIGSGHQRRDSRGRFA